MATVGPLYGLVDSLRATLRPGDGAEPTDGQLLEAFVAGRDAAALGVLVRRHGPMVWGVCRRALSNRHDAEDAFQATFLVLVRRAASVEPPDRVGNWLYGVACQTARKARATAARRKGRERQVAALPDPAGADPDPPADLGPVVDQELSRVPDQFRAVVVLCDLEGKTRAEAARELDLPEGTVASRLARGRRMLADRLAGRGVAPAVLVPGVVPAGVLDAAVRATALVAAGNAAAGVVAAEVVALADAATRAALTARLSAVLALLLGLVGLGVAAALTVAPPDPPAAPGPAPGATDAARLQGDWRTVRIVVRGEAVPFAEGDGLRYRFAGDTVTVSHPAREADGPTRRGRFGGLAGRSGEAKLALLGQFGGRGGPWAVLDADQRQALTDRMRLDPGGAVQVAFDVTLDEAARAIDRRIAVGGVEKVVVRGVYDLGGDALRIWEAAPMGDRPTAEQIRAGDGCTLWVFERAAPR